ncbi:MAG: radical SAM protein, partial [Elusimicrobia bacterium]|nr:radical SAM protein [Elusimicrobiota bacterium]
DTRSSMVTAPILEIFASLQGEGIRLGEEQIFVRLAGCNMNCDYCDTPLGKFADHGQHQTAAQVFDRINEINKLRSYRTISITGGEPLLYPEFLLEFLPLCKQNGFITYCDTNGTLPDVLALIIPWIDMVSMDFKLESDCHVNVWDSHEEFLKAGADKIFVKLVVTSRTRDEEILTAVNLIRKINKRIPLVIQPVTPVEGIDPAPQSMVMHWFEMAHNLIPDTRLIPQKHPEWNVH